MAPDPCDLIVERVRDELIVFDPRTDEVHLLNADAVAVFRTAGDDVSRRTLLRGGLLVGGGAAVTTLLSPTAASALSTKDLPGPLSPGIDLATQFATFLATAPATGGTNTMDFVVGADTAGVISPTLDSYYKMVPVGPVTAMQQTAFGGPPAGNYVYAVTAVDVLGNEGLPTEQPFTMVSPPHSVVLDWPDETGATTYSAYRKTAPSGTYVRIGSGIATSTGNDSNGATTAVTPPVTAPAGGVFAASGLAPAVGYPSTATSVSFTMNSTARLCIGFTVPATYLGNPLLAGSGLTLKLAITATFSAGTLTATFATSGNLAVAAASGTITNGTLSTVTSTVFSGVTSGTTYYVVLTKTAAGNVTGTLNLTAS